MEETRYYKNSNGAVWQIHGKVYVKNEKGVYRESIVPFKKVVEYLQDYLIAA